MDFVCKVFYFIIIITIICVQCVESINTAFPKEARIAVRGNAVDPEIFMNVTQLITSKGYPCEEHKVYTQDGYILDIQRIPHGYHRHIYDFSAKPVVLLQHGLLSSSDDWVDNLPNQSLGFVLADAGFDVWLGNSRGNTYGLKHKSLSPNQAAFWDFTWDDMGAYDLPATIDKVLSVSGQSSLVYIGYSQGSQMAFAQYSVNKMLASKVKLFVALAPVAFLGHVKSPIRLLAPYARNITLLFSIFGVHDFLPSDDITRWLAEHVCEDYLANFLCENILFVFGGYDFKHLNSSRIPVYVAHSPAGTSVKNIIHYAQSVQSGKFEKFDYGKEGNMQHYKQEKPPLYKPEDIDVPIALYSGLADWLAVPDDVMLLKAKLKRLIKHVIIDDWEHLDFIWAMNGPQACYDDVIQLIRQYNNLV